MSNSPGYIQYSSGMKICRKENSDPKNRAIEYRKFELGIHDLHFRRILCGKKASCTKKGLNQDVWTAFLCCYGCGVRGEGWSIMSSSSSSLRSHTSPVVVLVVVVVSSDINAAREEKQEPTMFCADMDNYLSLKCSGRWLRHANFLQHNFCPLLFY